jgi:hypothetical protein
VTALPVLDPRIPSTCTRPTGSGSSSGLRTGRVLAGFRPEDAALAGHPRDPFHRVDVRGSSRRVQLFLETLLPVRYYVPPEA